MPNYKDTNIPVYPSLGLFDEILSGVISLELTSLGIVTRKAAAARPLVRAPYTVLYIGGIASGHILRACRILHFKKVATMDAREVKVIDTSGRNGQPGVERWAKKPAIGNCFSRDFLRNR